MAKINITTFKKALKNSGGNQARIAKQLEVSRAAVNQYLKKNPKLKDLLQSEAEFIADISEDIIDTEIIVARDLETAKWKLLNSKIGRARGYGSKTEIEHSGNVPVTINLIEKSVEEIKRGKLGNKPKAGSDPESS